MNIYWANSIFSQADRDFNSTCVMQLRELSYTVLSPQDKPFNHPQGKSDAAQIFKTDTEAIQDCDILVACIDQESINCGVACEIGIAWCWNKHIVALYTDFRQFRSGDYTMYKNPYVIGCIQDRGEVVTCFDDLLSRLGEYCTNE